MSPSKGAVAIVGFAMWHFCILSSARGEELQEPAPARRTLPGLFRIDPLVVVGTEIVDTPGAKLTAIWDRTYSLETGLRVFWGAAQIPGAKEPEVGLFSLRDGQVRTVRMKGDKGPSPNTLRPLRPDLHLYPSDEAPGFVRGQRFATPIHAGKDLLYLSFRHGSLDGGSSVFAWDGEALSRVLAEKEVIALRGVNHTVDYARVLGIEAHGRAVIYFKASRGVSGWMLHDGGGLTPLQLSGDPLTGQTGAFITGLQAVHTVKPLPLMIRRQAVFAQAEVEPVGFWDTKGASLALLEVKGTPYKQALFRLSSGGAEKLLGIDEPPPTGPRQLVVQILQLKALSADCFALRLRRRGSRDSGDPQEALMLYHLGEWHSLFDASSLPEPWTEMAVEQFDFVTADPVRLAFLVTMRRQPTRDERLGVEAALAREGIHDRRLTEIAMTDLYSYSEGGPVSNLTTEIPLGSGSLFQALAGPLPGVILHAQPSHGPRYGLSGRVALGFDGDLTFLPALPEARAWFFDLAGPESTPEAPPRLGTFNDREVHLGNVLRWETRDTALLDLSDGLYLLTRTGEPSDSSTLVPPLIMPPPASRADRPLAPARSTR